MAKKIENQEVQQEVQLTKEDFASDQVVKWCPGCGDHAILKAVQDIFPKLGVKKEDIALRYENSYLTIEAKKDERKDEKDDSGNYIRRERTTGSVSRSFYIDGIDESKVGAEFTDGVLKVELPKQTKADVARQIEIK